MEVENYFELDETVSDNTFILKKLVKRIAKELPYTDFFFFIDIYNKGGNKRNSYRMSFFPTHRSFKWERIFGYELGRGFCRCGWCFSIRMPK